MATSIRPAAAQSTVRAAAPRTSTPTAAQAPAPAPLQLERAKVGEWSGRSTWPRVGGFTVESKPVSRSADVALSSGGTTRLEWSDETLSLKNPKTGASVTLERANEREFAKLQAFMKDEAGTDSGWDSSRNFVPVSSAGQLLSAREVVSSYTGGAHPNNGSQVRTWDARTGKPVKLDQLLTPGQFQQVLVGVKKGFDQLPDAESYRPDNLSKAVRENFALVKDGKGKVHIEVLLPSYVHALGGTEASFRFAAPDDAAFRAKAGL